MIDLAQAPAARRAASASAGLFQIMGGSSFVSRSVDVHSTESIRARRANRLGADLTVSLRLPQSDDPGVYFFASTMSRSEAGALLASSIAGQLGLPVDGRANPILKHTRSPAVIVTHPELSSHISKGIVAGINGFFVEAVSRQSLRQAQSRPDDRA